MLLYLRLRSAILTAAFAFARHRLARVHYIGMPRQRMVLQVDAGAAAFGGDALTANAFDAAAAARGRREATACERVGVRVLASVGESALVFPVRLFVVCIALSVCGLAASVVLASRCASHRLPSLRP